MEQNGPIGDAGILIPSAGGNPVGPFLIAAKYWVPAFAGTSGIR